MKNHSHRWAPFLLAALLAPSIPGSVVRAQGESERCASYTFLAPAGPGLAYTFPLHYGSFADVEIGSSGSGTVSLELTVFEGGGIRDRRQWVLLPGKVELASEILGVEDLFEIGSSLVVRIEASEPVSAVLVRRD